VSNNIQQSIGNNEQWAAVRQRLLTVFPPSFYPERTVEMLDLCRASSELRQLLPFISIGRLGLARYDAYERGIADDFMCLYFYDGQYVASNQSNEEKRFFDTAEAAIAFAKKHLSNDTPFQ
jgi:hypothetical protein